MKKILVIFSFLFIFSNFLIIEAREVDKDKLKNFINMDLEFINYRGEYDFTNTYDQIIGIGDFLAKDLKKSNSNSNYYNKYLINRYIDDNDAKSSVDVFIIGDRSELDGILNLRRILTGYLMRAFDYNRASAELLAKVITIYNAVYRGDIDHYKNTYIEPSVRTSSNGNVGLSRVYSQWAGKTQMFIPLKKDILSGEAASEIDLDKLVTEKVISSLLSENDTEGVDAAREITDLQGETHEGDQSKIDGEFDKLKDNETNINETIENLKQQLETATDETKKQNLQKQIDDAKSRKDSFGSQSSNVDKVQEKIDSSEKKLDTQREVIKEKIQENIDSTNKDKNLPKPGEINSSNQDKGLQEQEDLSMSSGLSPANSNGANNTLGETPSSSSVSVPEMSKPSSATSSPLNKAQQSPSSESTSPSRVAENNQSSNNTPLNRAQPQKEEQRSIVENNQQTAPLSPQLQNRAEKQSPVPVNQTNNTQTPPQTLANPSSPSSIQDSKDKAVFLEVLDPNTNLAVLEFIDSSTGGKLNKGTQSGIKRYGVYERDKDLVAIKMEGNKAKLQILDKSNNLEVDSESGFEISKDSSLFVDSKMILVVVNDNNKFKLAKFAPNNLNIFTLSEIEVLPFTSFTVKGNFVLLQDVSKKVVILNINTLKQVS